MKTIRLTNEFYNVALKYNKSKVSKVDRRLPNLLETGLCSMVDRFKNKLEDKVVFVVKKTDDKLNLMLRPQGLFHLVKSLLSKPKGLDIMSKDEIEHGFNYSLDSAFNGVYAKYKLDAILKEALSKQK